MASDNQMAQKARARQESLSNGSGHGMGDFTPDAPGMGHNAPDLRQIDTKGGGFTTPRQMKQDAEDQERIKKNNEADHRARAMWGTNKKTGEPNYGMS